MADVVTEKQAPVNYCCQVWIDKYSKIQVRRNALRQALELLEKQLDKLQAANVNLKKESEEERARAEVEKKGREKELAARVLLEAKIFALKTEISVLQQKGGSHAQDISEEVKVLQVHNNRLKDLYKKEIIAAASEKKNAEAEKKRVAEAWTYVKSEKNKTDEQRRLADIERKKAEEEKRRAEYLSRQLEEARTRIVELQKKINELVQSETSKLEEANKKLQAEKEEGAKERKRANSELAKAEEQRKLAEANWKLAEKEKHRAENLSQQLEEASIRILELQKKINQPEHLRYSSETCALEKLPRVGGETKLVSEYSKSKEVIKRVEFEKQTATGEKKHADHPEMVRSSRDGKGKSSSMYASSISSSDGPLLGSKERGAFSVTTSSELVKGSLIPQPTNPIMPGEGNKVRCNGNLAVVAEDSARSPLRNGGVRIVNGPSKKRKWILANESAEENIGVQHFYGSNELMKEKVDARISRQASQPSNDRTGTAQTCAEAMTAGVTEKQAAVNPCCGVWKGRYLKIREKRNALRQALKLFEPQFDKIRAENVTLKRESEEELAARYELETEISDLKSEISVLQEQVKLLKVYAFGREKETNNCLKELLLEKEINAEKC